MKLTGSRHSRGVCSLTVVQHAPGGDPHLCVPSRYLCLDVKLNLGKTELLFLPAPLPACPLHDLSITVNNSTGSLSQSAKNLGVILDNTLSFC